MEQDQELDIDMEDLYKTNVESTTEDRYEGDKLDAVRKRDPVTPYGPGVRSYFVV